MRIQTVVLTVVVWLASGRLLMANQERPTAAPDTLEQVDQLRVEAERLLAFGKDDQAFEAIQRMVTHCREQFTSERPRLLQALTYGAAFHEQLGKWEEAVALRQECAKLASERYGDTDWHVTDAKTAVSVTEAMSRMPAADRRRLQSTVFRLAKAIRVEQYDPSEVTFSQQTADQINGTPGALKPQISQLTEIIAERKQLLGDKHPLTAEALHVLGRFHLRFEQWSQAHECSQEAFDIRRQSLGDSHPDTIRSLINLGTSHHRLNESKVATRLHEQALTQLKSLGDDDQGLRLLTLSVLCGEYRGAGNAGAEIKTWEDYLQRLEESSPDNLVTIHSAHILFADVLIRHGEIPRARLEVEGVRRAFRESPDPALRDAEVPIRPIHATVLHAIGDHQQARSVFEGSTTFALKIQRLREPRSLPLFSALDQRGEVAWRDHLRKVELLYQLQWDSDGRPVGGKEVAIGLIQLHRRQISEAIASFRSALEMNPQDSDAQAMAHWCLGCAGLTDPAFDVTVAVTELELAARQIEKNESRRGTADVLCDLGDAYSRLGQFQAARQAYRRALAMLTASGRANPDDLQATLQLKLGAALHHLKEYPAARKEIERGLAGRRDLMRRHLLAMTKSKDYTFNPEIELWYDAWLLIRNDPTPLERHYRELFRDCIPLITGGDPQDRPFLISFSEILRTFGLHLEADRIQAQLRTIPVPKQPVPVASAPVGRPRQARPLPVTPDIASFLVTESMQIRRRVIELRRKNQHDEVVKAQHELLALTERRAELQFSSDGTEKADVLESIAETEEKLDHWGEAIRLRKAAIEIWDGGKSEWRMKSAHEELQTAEIMAGLDLEQRRRVRQAEEDVDLASEPGTNRRSAARALESALTTRKELLGRTHPDTLMLYEELCKNRVQAGDNKGALRWAEEGVREYREAPPTSREPLAKALMLAGVTARMQKNEKWQTYLEESATTPADPSSSVPAESLFILGSYLSEDGRQQEGRTAYLRALALDRLDPVKRTIAQSMVGAALLAKADYAAAEQTFQKVWDEVKSPSFTRKSTLQKVLCMVGLGTVAQMRGDLATARLFLEDADSFAQHQASDESVASLLPLRGLTQMMLGSIQSELGDHKAAIEHLTSSERILFPGFLPPPSAQLMGFRYLKARTLVAAGMLDAGLKEFDRSESVLRKLPAANHVILAQIEFERGMARGIAGRSTEARSDLESSLTKFRQADPPEPMMTARCLSQLGLTLVDLNENELARQSVDEALSLMEGVSQSDPARVLVEIAAGIVALKTKQAAAGHLQTALASLGSIAERASIIQSEREQLLTLRQVRSLLDLYLSATSTHQEAGSDYESVLSWKGSVTRRQRLRKLEFEGWNANARALGRDLADVSRQLMAISGPSMPASSLTNPSAATDPSRLESPAVRVRELLDRREKLERELLTQSPEFQAEVQRSQGSIVEIQKVLPPGSVLIDLIQYNAIAPQGESSEWSRELRLAAFIVRPDSRQITRFDLGPTEPIANLVRRWRETIGAGKSPAQDEENPGVALRKLIWDPLQSRLHDVKLVLISPDGPLSSLPFSALPGAKPGDFLLDEYAFVTIPVPQLLLDLKTKTPEARPSLLLVGDIDFGKPTGTDTPQEEVPFSPLPGTLTEIESVRKSFLAKFPDSPVVLQQAQDATKLAFTSVSSGSRYIHVATHGFFSDQAASGNATAAPSKLPLRGVTLMNPAVVGKHYGFSSGIVFAGANGGSPESLLSALEVGDLSLENCEMVVLSACNTGLGQIADGEGVLGLQRAFQIAGARTTVASLWSVDDRATQLLMAEFYHNYWERKLSKIESLRQAQQTLIHGYDPATGTVRGLGGKRPLTAGIPPQGSKAPPVFWAAFTLSGDWN